jgi:mRNA interferase MazF
VSESIQPWQVWWGDPDPVRGHEQRPVIIVSSRFQLQLTRSALVTVLPLTTRQRPGWAHHVPLTLPGHPISYVVTEQIRTMASGRLTGPVPFAVLTPAQIADVRPVLRSMIDLG